MREAADHPHVGARGSMVHVDGEPQPAPAPRFSATPAAQDRPPAVAGQHTDEVLAAAGFTPDEIATLRSRRTVGGSPTPASR
jgi:alpha-methylacyl-CoA racemase